MMRERQRNIAMTETDFVNGLDEVSRLIKTDSVFEGLVLERNGQRAQRQMAWLKLDGVEIASATQEKGIAVFDPAVAHESVSGGIAAPVHIFADWAGSAKRRAKNAKES